LIRLAGKLLRDRPFDSLRPTELVNESWFRFHGQSTNRWQRTQFLYIAALQMRRILVDRARARKAGKRGGDAVTIALDDANGVLAEPDINVLELDEALTAFEALDPRAAEVFALRAFSGCSMKEASECLGVSLSSVERDWRTAKAWLKLQLARTQV